MKAIDILRTGDTVFYTSYGENRQVMVTRIDKKLGEFEGLLGISAEVWGRASQITAIHAKNGSRYMVHNGMAFLD